MQYGNGTSNMSNPRSGMLGVVFLGINQNEISLFGKWNDFLDRANNYRKIMLNIFCVYSIIIYVCWCVCFVSMF